MKWYVKLALAFGALILIFASFVIYDQITSGELIFKAIIPGGQGEKQVITFTVDEPKANHVLIIHPSIESGWGDPDVYIVAELADPENNVLFAVGTDTIFGGTRPTIDYQRGYSDYEEKFPFVPTSSGVYTLSLVVLTEHVKDVYIAVTTKRNN